MFISVLHIQDLDLNTRVLSAPNSISWQTERAVTNVIKTTQIDLAETFSQTLMEHSQLLNL